MYEEKSFNCWGIEIYNKLRLKLGKIIELSKDEKLAASNMILYIVMKKFIYHHLIGTTHKMKIQSENLLFPK